MTVDCFEPILRSLLELCFWNMGHERDVFSTLRTHFWTFWTSGFKILSLIFQDYSDFELNAYKSGTVWWRQKNPIWLLIQAFLHLYITFLKPCVREIRVMKGRFSKYKQIEFFWSTIYYLPLLNLFSLFSRAPKRARKGTQILAVVAVSIGAFIHGTTG